MIRRDTDYAFRVLVHVAARGGQLATADELAEAGDVPRSFAAKVLRKLVQAGVLDSRPGNRGGFSLGRPPEEITMLDLVEAIQGPMQVSLCTAGEGLCSRQGRCPVSSRWHHLQEQMAGFLRSTTLRDLLGSPRGPRRTPALSECPQP